MKKQVLFLITAALFIVGAGVIETIPVITLICLVGIVLIIGYGRLDEVSDDERL